MHGHTRDDMFAKQLQLSNLKVRSSQSQSLAAQRCVFKISSGLLL